MDHIRLSVLFEGDICWLPSTPYHTYTVCDPGYTCAMYNQAQCNMIFSCGEINVFANFFRAEPETE